MTDQILHSNQSSVILRSLPKLNQEDLSYFTPPAYPILIKNVRSQPTDVAVPATVSGSEISWRINKAYLWRNCAIKTTYVIPVANVPVTQFIGLSMFDYITLSSSNNQLCRNNDSYIQARVRQEGTAAMMNKLDLALPLAVDTELPIASTAVLTAVTYTPFYCSFFENIVSNVDLVHMEQLTITARFNSTARAGLPNAITSAVCELVNWCYDLDPDAMQVLRMTNLNPEKPLSMYTYSSDQQREPCIGNLTNTMKLNTNRAVTTTHIMLKNNGSVAGFVNAKHRRIDFVQVAIQQNDLIPKIHRNIINYETRNMGAGCIIPTGETTVSRERPDIITIHWGMEKSRAFLSGGLSLSNINFATITLFHEDLSASSGTAAGVDFIVNHEFAQLTTLNGNNGTFRLSQGV